MKNYADLSSGIIKGGKLENKKAGLLSNGIGWLIYEISSFDFISYISYFYGHSISDCKIYKSMQFI